MSLSNFLSVHTHVFTHFWGSFKKIFLVEWEYILHIEYYIAYSTMFCFTIFSDRELISSWIHLVAPQAVWLLVSMLTVYAANNNHNYLAFPILADRQIVGNCLPLQRKL